MSAVCGSKVQTARRMTLVNGLSLGVLRRCGGRMEATNELVACDDSYAILGLRSTFFNRAKATIFSCRAASAAATSMPSGVRR